MKISIEDAAEILEIAKSFQPMAKDIVKVIQQYGPDVYELLSGTVDGICDLKIRAIKRFTASGLTKEQAVLLTIDTMNAVNKSLKRTEKDK